MGAPKLTKLGKFFEDRSLNKAAIARKTGLSKNRLSQLSINTAAQVKAEELYLIALAADVEPGELLELVCGEVRLLKQESY
jgi:DNA-binding Xre family transcriptional regulator